MTPLLLRQRKHPIAGFMVTMLTTFLVLFPKGGIKAGTLPLTWGYLMVMLTLPPLLVMRLLATPLRFRPATLAAVASVVPFSTLYLYSFFVNGVEFPGIAFSTFVSLSVLPPVFLLLYPGFLDWIDGVRLAAQLRFCMLAAALFGIFLFVWHPLTGHFIEIPYLTVNADDFGQLEMTKHIDRGFFLKLISTYNNGNVYGVATLILLPLYNALEPKLWKRNILRLALILTLSRTIWAGLIVEQLLSLVRLGAQTVKTFPRVPLGPALRKGLLVVSTLVLVLAGLALSSRNLTFLFDSDLGGRAGSLSAFAHPTLLPSVPLTAFSEIVYASALSEYGVLGFLSVILIFIFPIVLCLLNPRSIESPLRRAALKGMILYMVLAGLDGALNLIPVMAFYWFAYMIFLEGWPGGLDLSPVGTVSFRPSRPAIASRLSANRTRTASLDLHILEDPQRTSR